MSLVGIVGLRYAEKPGIGVCLSNKQLNNSLYIRRHIDSVIDPACNLTNSRYCILRNELCL